MFRMNPGRGEVYVQPFPGPGEKQRISMDGGTGPIWNPNGRELLFIARAPEGKSKMMAVDILSGETLNYGTPRSLFEGTWTNYDVTPDGRHFIMARPEDLPDRRVTKLNIVLNWFDELKRRVPRGTP